MIPELAPGLGALADLKAYGAVAKTEGLRRDKPGREGVDARAEDEGHGDNAVDPRCPLQSRRDRAPLGQHSAAQWRLSRRYQTR